MNALVYVNIEQGIHKGQNNVAWSEKEGKNYVGILIHGTFHWVQISYFWRVVMMIRLDWCSIPSVTRVNIRVTLTQQAMDAATGSNNNKEFLWSKFSEESIIDDFM